MDKSRDSGWGKSVYANTFNAIWESPFIWKNALTILTHFLSQELFYISAAFELKLLPDNLQYKHNSQIKASEEAVVWIFFSP